MLTKTYLLLAATMLSLMIAGQTSSAQARRWAYLGEANVDGGNDHDNIKVGGDEGRYRALQIQVERAAIDFQRVVVHYDNGGDDTLPIRGRVPAGGKSRVIDLRGGQRIIRSVEIWYARGNWRNDAKPKLRRLGAAEKAGRSLPTH